MVRVCEKYCYPNNFIVKSQKKKSKKSDFFFYDTKNS